MTAVRLPPPLIALTPGDAEAARSGELERRVAAAVKGGLRGVLLREPELEDGPFERLAARLRSRLDAVGGWLGIHDRPHLAAAAKADGVHLGFRSLEPAEVRDWLPGVALGLSTHAPAVAGVTDGWSAADYLFHGPFGPVQKDPPLEPVGTAGLARAVSGTDRPIWALGGIAPGDVPEVLASGVRGVAVLSGILPDADPERRAAEYAAACPQ